MTISSIYEPIQEDMARVEDSLRAISMADFPWMTAPLKHVVESGGKRIRPALTLLSGKFYRYDPKLIPMATAIELFHAATLVHDDTVDKSSVRRGRPTVNSLWGEEIAVLLGDYLFSKSADLVCSAGDLRVMKVFAQTLMNISSGQLRQFVKAFDWRQDRQEYYRQIESKTASLFAAAGESGAILSEAPAEGIEALKTYGRDLGIAFQIVDDVLDFVGEEDEMGKPVGSDLLQGTLTLPVIFLMERHPDHPVVSEVLQSGCSEAGVKHVIEMIHNSSIIEECYQAASDFCAQACRALEQLPENASRRSLLDLANYVIERRR